MRIFHNISSSLPLFTLVTEIKDIIASRDYSLRGCDLFINSKYEILRESNRKSFQFFQMQSMLWEKLEIGTKAKTKLQP